MGKARTVRNTQMTLSGKTPMELALGRRPRDLLDPASMNPEQLTSTPTKQDLLNEEDLLDPASMNPEQLTSTPTKQDLVNEEIRKKAMRTHLQVQQREDIRRDLAERMKFVPHDHRARESVFYLQEDQSKIQQGWKSGEWLKVEIIAVKGPMTVINTGANIVQANVSNLRRPFGTVQLKELPDSRGRTRAPVLWLL